jgi:hypothetical protein
MKYVPYIVLEIVLPGGTLFACGLWAWRNRKDIYAAVSNRLAAIRLIGRGELIQS